jgi:peptidyl-prolyl cis-trans isomerase D
MLAFIRRYLTSWPVLALFGLILVAFAVTGVNDPIGGAAPVGSVARVGKRTITEAELLEAIDRTVRDLRQRNPAMSQAQAARDGAVDLLATQLIGQAAMEETAAAAGMNASDTAVDKVIAGIPAFQVAGKFDQATYTRVISSQGLTDKRLRQQIAGDLLREQLIKPTTGALAVPDAVAETYARLLVDRHEGAIALVPATPAGAATPAEARAWYEANKARLALPERRGFRYAFIDRARVVAGITISDKQIADAFAADPAKYGGAATRVLEQVVLPDEARARQLVAAAAAKGFAAAASAIGFGAEDIALGPQTQAAFARATSADVARAAFALAPQAISAPVRSPLGWHVVRFARAGAEGRTLAQARPLILADLKARAADAAVGDIVNRIEDGVEAGNSFADLAKELGLAISTQGPVAADGRSEQGAPLAGDMATLAARAFRQEADDGPTVQDLGGGRLAVLETNVVLAAAPPPLADVMPLALAGAAQDKAMKAARRTADAVLAATTKGTAFAKAVADAGLAPVRTVAARRIDLIGQPQAPPLLRAFLDTAPGTTRIETSPAGWVLIRVDRLVPGDPRAQAGLIEASRREVGGALPAEMAEAVARASMAAAGVDRNAATLAAIRRRLIGDDTP